MLLIKFLLLFNKKLSNIYLNTKEFVMVSQLKFSSNLKLLRSGNNKQGKKYSQAQVASSIGIARSAISEYENGNKEPTLSVILKLAQFFDITLDELCL